MEKKGWFSFKRLGKKSSGWTWRLKSSGFRWRKVTFQLGFIDDFVFMIVSVFEAIVLVSTLCFFYLCCGCNF